MTVEVQAFANLARYLPPGSHRGTVTVEVPEGTTLKALVESLGVPAECPRLLLVNGQERDPGYRLAPGDVVSLLPPLVGGGAR